MKNIRPIGYIPATPDTVAEKVLITGANGFVGSYLTQEAINQGFLTHAGVRKTSNLQYLTDPRISYLYYSMENEDQLRENLKAHHFDYIILNAGVTKAKDRESYFKINAGYVRKFCKILIEENLIPKKLVLISSLASYGPADYQVKQILDSDSVPHPVTWYGESKLQAEQFVQSFRVIPHIILRPTAVYGPRDTEMISVYKTVKMGLSPKIGSGNMDATFIHVQDLARLTIDSLKARAQNKAYFVSDGSVYPIHKFNATVADLLGKKAREITIPFSVMKVAAFFSETLGKLQGKAMTLNRNKIKEYFARSFEMDISDLEKDFNFAPRYSIRKGLEETLEWCIKNKLL